MTPRVIWAASPNHDSRRGHAVDAIVLHHTGPGTVQGILAHLRRRGSGVSAHYLVSPRGTVYQLVSDGRRAWHAGKSELHGKPDVNARSIGIELVNPGDGKTPFPEAQYRALEGLLRRLVAIYAIPPGNVVGHRDVALPRGRKVDPAANFDWARIWRVLGT